jgi:hypothetical protein
MIDFLFSTEILTAVENPSVSAVDRLKAEKARP